MNALGEQHAESMRKRTMTTTIRSLFLMASLAFASVLTAQDETAPPAAEPAAVTETTAAEPAAPAATEEPAAAEEAAPSVGTPDEALQTLMTDQGPAFDFFTISNLWLLIATALVFLMHLGFSTVESGLCQSKNTNNILFKNVFIVCMGILAYAAWGYNAMYPGVAGSWNGFFAMGKPFENIVDPANLTYDYGKTALCMTKYTDFLFQAMFAATAATIVSGAVAERVKLSSFMIYAIILVTFAYPLTGSWQWGQGWLFVKGFKDFAGSTLVHAFGGFAALAAVLVLGPRRGKYLPDGKVRPILPHSMPLAAIGVFLLFLGWFGFNGGSVLSASPGAVSMVFVTTTLAGVAGGIGSMLTSWVTLKKPDLSMMLNGMLAGLVGITAGADVIPVWSSVLVGLIAGVLVVFSVFFFDKIKVDDPVGAISVHGVCGVWGTAAVGIFSLDDAHTLGTQLLGVFSVGIFAFVVSFILFFIIKLIMGVRVSEEEERVGLDVEEHGTPAYHFGADSNDH